MKKLHVSLHVLSLSVLASFCFINNCFGAAAARNIRDMSQLELNKELRNAADAIRQSPVAAPYYADDIVQLLAAGADPSYKENTGRWPGYDNFHIFLLASATRARWENNPHQVYQQGCQALETAHQALQLVIFRKAAEQEALGAEPPAYEDVAEIPAEE